MRLRIRTMRYAAVAPAAALAAVALPATAHAQTFVIPCKDTAALNKAIIASNTSPGADRILLAPCAYTFPVVLSGETALTPITGSLTISGLGSTLARTGTAKFRLLKVAQTGRLTLNGVTLKGGNVDAPVPGQATQPRSQVGCSSSAPEDIRGGAVLNQGALTLNAVTITANKAWVGGGVYTDQNADLKVAAGIISRNTAVTGSGGGIFGDQGSDVTLQGVAVSDNSSGWCGGGIHTQFGDTLVVRGSSIIRNKAEEGAEG